MASGLRRGEEAAVPSSMIFASLVVLWLLILVPAVARHRQEVARPSVAALSGRVLARSPRRRGQEVDRMSERDRTDAAEDGRAVATRELRVPSARSELRVDGEGATRSSDREGGRAEVRDAEHRDGDERRAEVRDTGRRDDGERRAEVRAAGRRDDGERQNVDDAPGTHHEFGDDYHDAEALDDDWAEDDDAPDDRAWERPPPRYRAGRGGFDAEAAALTARARYAFRQRVVLVMLVAALATGIAAAVVSPVVWWAHIGVDVMLVGYLAYLRRQVRMEEAIRARRAARMAGTRRPSAADDPDLDEWAERGRDATFPAELDDEPDWSAEDPPAAESAAAETPEDAPAAAAASDAPPAVPSPALSTETTSPASSEPRAVAVVPAPPEEERPALPRLRQTPLPPLPAGTTLVDGEEDDLDLDDGTAPGYRRAVGQ